MYLVFSRPLRALPTLEHLQTNSLELAHRAQLRTRVTAPCSTVLHTKYIAAVAGDIIHTQLRRDCWVHKLHDHVWPAGVACHQRAEYVPRLPRARRRSRGERAHITMQQPAGGAGFLTLEGATSFSARCRSAHWISLLALLLVEFTRPMKSSLKCCVPQISASHPPSTIIVAAWRMGQNFHKCWSHAKQPP